MEGNLSREHTVNTGDELSKSSKKTSKTKLKLTAPEDKRTATLDFQRLKANLIKRVLPSEVDVSALCAMAKSILCEEPNLVSLSAPAKIIGNIHGQYEDLLSILSITGQPPQSNLIFLGSNVNRGPKGLETILHILSLKVEFPSGVQLLRGNHDCRWVTQSYGFYDECCKKYGTLNVYNDITDLFDYLPVAGVLENSAFVVHGGLSPHMLFSEDIQKIDRHREIPKEGALCDLLWSDPCENTVGWGVSTRGYGYLFGEDVTATFLHQNGLQKIYRAHTVSQEGVKEFHSKQVLSIWSAPNFCNKLANKGAILEVSSTLEEKVINFTESAKLPAGNYDTSGLYEEDEEPDELVSPLAPIPELN